MYLHVIVYIHVHACIQLHVSYTWCLRSHSKLLNVQINTKAHSSILQITWKQSWESTELVSFNNVLLRHCSTWALDTSDVSDKLHVYRQWVTFCEQLSKWTYVLWMLKAAKIFLFNNTSHTSSPCRQWQLPTTRFSELTGNSLSVHKNIKHIRSIWDDHYDTHRFHSSSFRLVIFSTSNLASREGIFWLLLVTTGCSWRVRNLSSEEVEWSLGFLAGLSPSEIEPAALLTGRECNSTGLSFHYCTKFIIVL